MKLTLIFQTGSLAGQQRQLEQGSLLLGRAPDCSIQFDAQRDTLVSNRHAVIQREGDAFFLLDQNSTNGTFLNGNRVGRTQINPGDVIMFGNGGPQILVVIEQPGSQTSPSPGQQTTVAATAYTAPSSGQGGYGGPPPPYAPPGPPMGMPPPPGYPPAPPPPPMPQMGMP
ncbi:MAG TPA: FHA domain-containing protein, partial [Acidobacteriota bacterium]|nr:FHA domain-containing protein [Acidobacteriota bacterium]